MLGMLLSALQFVAPPLHFVVPHFAPSFTFRECLMNHSGGTKYFSGLTKALGVWLLVSWYQNESVGLPKPGGLCLLSS